MKSARTNLAFRQHDHSRCVATALSTARRLCEERGQRLTPLREHVLQLVWQSHRALGAYAILELLSAAQPGRRLAPPTVYRALEFLQENGLVHRINSLNAFIGCQQPQEHHQTHFLICRQCASVVEIFDEATNNAIHQAATGAAFAPESIFIEIAGLCPNCQQH
jgi:Fur family zinc uptake transcriptional regulator